METTYRLLFNVEFFHEFYKNSKGEYTHRDEDIKIVPTRDCVQSMLDQGLLFRTTPGGFSVLYQAYKEDSLVKPLIPLTEPRRFSFQLCAKNPYLVHYSALPLDTEKSGLYYLSNLAENSQNVAGNNEHLLVRDLNSPYISSLDEVSVTSSRFIYGFKKTGDTAVLTIHDRHDVTVYSEKLNKLEDGVTTGERNFRTSLDLESLGKGLFTLKIDSIEKEKFLIDDSLLVNKPFGLIDIFYGPEVPTAYQFADSMGQVSARQYTVRLNRRETTWKYLVGLKYRDDLNPAELQIVSSIFSATFTRQATYQMADKTQIVPFDSGSTRIPLIREPLKGFKLIRTIAASGSGPGGVSTEETRLPNPEISNLKIANGTIYSEVYIYV